ncbi:hypothetical protein PRNP1_013539 [Phytophthora ramorum]
MASVPTEDERTQVLNAYKAKVMEHREMESRVKNMRENVKTLVKEFNKTEDDLKALQSVGQIIGEVLRQLDEDRFIVKASSGPRYVVGCRAKVEKSKLKSGTRVALDMTTLTIMRYLPREVDPTVYHMLNEDAGNVSFSSIGGLNEQIRELREVIELPLTNPELFLRVGIKPPKGVLLYGPPGQVKMVMATNRPDILDPALLRPGRLDRKIEIPLPNEASRMDILKIHSGPITKKGEIDYESIVKLTDGFNGADMRNVCTEAGMFAIRADREYVVEEDFMKAARKLAETKKLESKMDYSKV